MAGTAGELGLHFLVKLLGLSARIMLPSLARQPIDHRITVGSKELAVQSKTRLLGDGQTVNTIYGRFKFFVDLKDDALDYYSFAVLPQTELNADSEWITLHLFAFVPIKFIQKHAIVDGQDRYITYEDLQASNDALSHVSLYSRNIRPTYFSIGDESFRALTSSSLEDRLIEALFLVDSPIDASRVLDMLVNDASLFKAFTAADPSHRVSHPQSAFEFQGSSSNASGLLKTLHDPLIKKTA